MPCHPVLWCSSLDPSTGCPTPPAHMPVLVAPMDALPASLDCQDGEEAGPGPDESEGAGSGVSLSEGCEGSSGLGDEEGQGGSQLLGPSQATEWGPSGGLGGRPGDTGAVGVEEVGGQGGATDGAVPSRCCGLCGLRLERYVLSCLCCQARFHVECMSQEFREQQRAETSGGSTHDSQQASSSQACAGGQLQFLPNGSCPFCGTRHKWLDLLSHMASYEGGGGEQGNQPKPAKGRRKPQKKRQVCGVA
jgi:hypothetical protein